MIKPDIFFNEKSISTCTILNCIYLVQVLSGVKRPVSGDLQESGKRRWFLEFLPFRAATTTGDRIIHRQMIMLIPSG